MNEITVEQIDHLLRTLDTGVIVLAVIAAILCFMFIKSIHSYD